MRVLTHYGPDTPEEVYLKEKLRLLQEAYRKEAEPILLDLVRLHELKTPKYFLVGGDPE